LEYEIMLRYKSMLEKAGIILIIKIVNIKEYQKIVKNGDYDIISSGFIADYPDIYSYLAPLFSKEALNEGITTFVYYKKIKLIKKMLEKASMSNHSERLKIYKKIDKIITDDAICLPLTQIIDLLIYKDSVKGLREDVLGSIKLFEVKIDEN
jgi:ABC-type oligopeptide transport system substrate-binding subunit